MPLNHHWRFFAALALGLLAYALSRALGWPDFWALQVILGGNVFFVFYLGLTALVVHRITARELRDRAANPDEGLPLILLVTAATVVFSVVAVFLLIQKGHPSGADAGPPGWVALPLAVAAVPLGWLTLHALVAFHYAHLYYTPGAKAAGGRRGDTGGLLFPRTPEPGLWDFLYYSYVVGMTAQVSDVDVSDAVQRRVTLAHGIFSFFYNTVILALAVNAAANLTQ